MNKNIYTTAVSENTSKNVYYPDRENKNAVKELLLFAYFAINKIIVVASVILISTSTHHSEGRPNCIDDIYSF